ncbi:MAG: acyl-homoserine-lactone acylase [Bacteroidia bacterium]|jgi:acyl-homoserine-lactone acylase
MKFIVAFILSMQALIPVSAQLINTENILILRDEFGVPYIYTETDAEAAYALAWVQCEDNFYDVQESLLGSEQMLGSVTGKQGAILDALSFIVNAEEKVSELYKETFTPEFKKIIEAYTYGINRYAETHQSDIRHPDLFPISTHDIIETYLLNLSLISMVQNDIIRIFEDKLDLFTIDNAPSGSNGFAFAPDKTVEGKTYMIANSHQPLEGFAAWYEVQINTLEGWNFHGATFAAGIIPAIGTNPDLGWTHTVNYDDLDDVYELEMHPTKKNLYKYDDEWLPLEKRKFKIKVKVGGIPLPISKTFYECKYGTVMKNKSGYYAIRFPANQVIGAAEQQYRMNKATNYQEFKAAVDMQQLPSLNFVYGDKEGNIMFLANGLFPERHPNYNWMTVLPGNTSETFWEAKFKPISALNMIENPSSGYVFNMNNSSFDCTGPENNPDPNSFDPTIGYQTGPTARSIRFQELMQNEGKISYADLKRLKYDSQMSFPLHTRSIMNLDAIRQLDPLKYPEIADVILKVTEWNGSAEVDNREAAILSLSVQHLLKYMDGQKSSDLNKALPLEEFVNALVFAKKHLLKHFGTIDIALGDLQKHVRGDVELPIWGIPEVITQMYTVPYKDGMYKTVLGESFILFATYGEDGLELVETINCFGASANEGSPHYTDQMQLFVDKKLKSISMDKDENLKKATQAYRPK